MFVFVAKLGCSKEEEIDAEIKGESCSNRQYY